MIRWFCHELLELCFQVLGCGSGRMWPGWRWTSRSAAAGFGHDLLVGKTSRVVLLNYIFYNLFTF